MNIGLITTSDGEDWAELVRPHVEERFKDLVHEANPLYVSVVQWPSEVALSNKDGISVDSHFLMNSAIAVTDALRIEGLGCQGEVFPIRTGVYVLRK